MSKKKNRLPVSYRGGVPARLEKSINRELARIDAAMDIEAHAVARHIDHITEATTRSMAAAGYISSVEVTVIRTAPHGQHRVTAMAETGCMGLQQALERVCR